MTEPLPPALGPTVKRKAIGSQRVHSLSLLQRFKRYWFAVLLALLALSTFVSGYCGFKKQADDQAHKAKELETKSEGKGTSAAAMGHEQAPTEWTVLAYRAVQLFLLNSGAEQDDEHPTNRLLDVARVSGVCLFLLVSASAVMRVYGDLGDFVRLLSRKGHLVICGLGQVGLELLDGVRDGKPRRRTVVIEKDPNCPWIDYARGKGAQVILGDATKADTLLESRMTDAAEVFVATGDDGVNLDVAAALRTIVDDETSQTKNLRAYLHVADTSFAATLAAFREKLDVRDRMQVELFNVPRAAATKLVTQQLWPFAPKSSEEVAHFFILGFGAMGRTVALQLASQAHFPNLKRSRFTIADTEIKRRAPAFLGRIPRFTSWRTKDEWGVDGFSETRDSWDWNDDPLPDGLRSVVPHAIQFVCNAQFCEVANARGDEQFVRRIAQTARESGVRPFLFICGEQDHLNFESAAHLRDLLRGEDVRDLPIFVYLPQQPALSGMLRHWEDPYFQPFGECGEAANYREVTAPIRNLIAPIIHESYEKKAAEKAAAKNESYVKTSWSAIPEQIRDSNRQAADHLHIKAASVQCRIVRLEHDQQLPPSFRSFTPPEVDILAKMEHNRWVAERLLNGWRCTERLPPTEKARIAAEKKRKLNADLVPWAHLGEERQKDYEQVEAVLRELEVSPLFRLETMEAR